MYTFTQQEFMWLQGFLNDLYQDANIRTGPSGTIVIALRNKFLVLGSVDLTDVERGFLLYNINDVYTTSHSPVVQPQLGNSVRYVGDEDTHGELRVVISSIQQLTGTSNNPETTPQYLPTWRTMTNIMGKLGKAPLPAPDYSPNASVDRQAENLGHQPNIDPDDRMM